LGSTQEVISHGKTGFLCNNIQECISAIDRVIELDRYTCRQYVENNFSIEQMTDGYEAVYQKIITERFSQNGHLRSLIGLASDRI
jgi:glycosyltransferase involved in cell wall biosynthesis